MFLPCHRVILNNINYFAFTHLDTLYIPNTHYNLFYFTMDDKALTANNQQTAPRRQMRRQSTKKPGFSRADQLSRLELYEMYDKNHPLNQPMRPEEGFQGPKKERSMTDRFCLFFLLIFLGGSVFHGIVLFSYGEIARLSSGSDLRDEVCGRNGLIMLPYLYFAIPSKDINVRWCVEQCPTATGRSICVYDIDHFSLTPFCKVQMTSTKMGRYCIPKEPVSRVIVDNHLSTKTNYVKRIMSDIYLSMDLIVISMIILAITAYFLTYLLSVQSIVNYLIWIQMWCSLLCFGALAYLFWLEYERVIKVRCLFQIDKHYCGGDRGTLFQLACAASAGLGVFFLLNIIQNFNKINLAISLIRASAKVVVVLSQLRFFAIFVAAVGFIQFSYSCLLLCFGMTIGERKVVPATDIDGSAVKIYEPLELYQYTLPYQAFMILFFLLFVMAVNEMFNSYALSVWFFTKKKDTVRIPLLVVLRELFIHHLGTCIFAVFMEIFFFVPKWTMYMVRLSMRSLPQESLVVRFFQGCCLCCLACYQNCLRYLSKHSLVQVAIFSEGYWVSSKKAYFLLSRNSKSVNDLDVLVEFILFLLKISNSLVVSLPIYFYLTYLKKTPIGNDINDIESPLIPTLFVFIIGFFYTSVFQVSYDMTTKAVIQLYLVDREMFYGEQRYVEDFIQNFMEFYGKAEEIKVKMKSHKQLKYNAQVAPMPKQEEVQDPSPEPSDEEENSEDEDEDIDMDEGEEDEPYQAGTSRGFTGRERKQGRLIDEDPFNMNDNLSVNKSEMVPPKSANTQLS